LRFDQTSGAASFCPGAASCSLGRVAERVSVKEAASILGISADAVRKRVARGTLKAEKMPDGTLFVWVDGKPGLSDADRDGGLRPTTAHLETLEKYIARLEAELEDRKEEARRKDHIIAALTQRIPALEAPPEAPPDVREPPETASEEPDKGAPPPPTGEERRPWWVRLFGG
jgi:hypothetical protein